MDRETVRRGVIDIFASWGTLRQLAGEHTESHATAKRVDAVRTLIERILKPEEFLAAIASSELVEPALIELAAERPQFTGEYHAALPHAAVLADAIRREASDAVDHDRFVRHLVYGEGEYPFDPAEIDAENCRRVLAAVADPSLLHGSPDRWIQAAQIELAALPEKLWGTSGRRRRLTSSRVTAKKLEAAVSKYRTDNPGPPDVSKIAAAIGYPNNEKAVRGTEAFKAWLRDYRLNRPPRGKRAATKTKSLDVAGYEGTRCVTEGTRHKGHAGAGFALGEMHEHRAEMDATDRALDQKSLDGLIAESLRESRKEPSPLSSSKKKYVRG